MFKAALLFLLLYFVTSSSFSQTISAEASQNYVGKTVTVAGKVVDGRYLASSSRQPTLLNVDKPFPDQIFSIVIYGEDRKSFGYKPEEVLVNKNVAVTGKVELYKGKPQIIVTNPEQIVIATAGADLLNSGKDSKFAGRNETKIKSAVRLRSGPGNDYKTIAKLKAGSIIHVLTSDSGWSYVSVERSAGKGDKDYTLNGFIKTDELK